MSIIRSSLVSLGLLLPSLGFGQGMTMLNAKDNDALDYPLAFLYGSTTHPGTEVRVDGLPWPVRQGFFKALVRLKPGANAVKLEFGGAQETFTLRYQPKVNPKFIRMVYFLGSDQDGTFEAPAGLSNQTGDAVARIKLAALLMQTFYAESWKRTVETVRGTTGRPKGTFRLETDGSGEPIVHVVKSTKRTAAQWRALASNSAYGEAHGEIRSKLPGGATFKQAVIMGFSDREHYNDQTARGTGVAWGGGSMNGSGDGATSGCTLYAWAPSLDRLVTAMTDKKAPESHLCRDWNKNTYMGNYATTLGGWFHEVGHTFGLGHPAYGIMSSQIDQIYRFFMIEDVSRNNQVLSPANELPNTWWHSSEVGTAETDFFTVTPYTGVPILARAAPRRSRFREAEGLGMLLEWNQERRSLLGRSLGSSSPTQETP